MKFTVRNTFDTDVDTYWNEVFFSAEYTTRLYTEALAFKGFELVELTGAPGERRTRVMRTEPAAQAPAMVQKLIGESLTYTERGTWEPDTKLWSYAIETNKLTDKVTIGGTLRAEPRPEGRCERFAEIEIQVRVPLVGGAVERFIEKTTRDSYVKAAKFTNEFIAEKGLQST